jgi:signal transduction histidine kinase
MAIDRRRFLALPAIGVPAIVVGKRLGILAWLKSYFFAPRGVSLTAERIDERARLARDLHESALTALIVTEIRMDVLRRKLLAQASPLASELGSLQSFIREEALRHRERMQQMNPLDSSTFIPFLKDTVERFQRETGLVPLLVASVLLLGAKNGDERIQSLCAMANLIPRPVGL